MKNILQKYINEPHNTFNNKELWIMRENIITLLKSGYDFSEQEIDFILRHYWMDSITNYFPLNEIFLKKWVDNGYDIKRFPQSIYKDEEITEYFLTHATYVDKKLVENITPDIIKRYAQNHSDYDFYRIFKLCSEGSKYKNQILELNDSGYYSQRLKDGEKSFNNNSGLIIPESFAKHDDVLEDTYKPINIVKEPKSSHKLAFIVNPEKIILTNEVLLKPEKSLSKRKIDLSLWDEKSNKYVFSYISDLHLTHKIKMLTDKGLDKKTAVTNTVLSAVNGILKSIKKFNDNYISGYKSNVLLIAGDISYDYNVNYYFFSLLKEKLHDTFIYTKLYVVLGNHELWDGDPVGAKNTNINDIIEKYNKMFEKLDIKLLNNDVVVFCNSYRLEYSFDEIISKKDEIKEAIKKCEFCIFGSTGFSGLNKNFNAQNGIYRGAIRDIETEKLMSEQTSIAFSNLLELHEDRPIICLTHMPYTDWYAGNNDLSNCYFINGHTHSNYYRLGNPTIYSDNQIGYSGEKYSTKQFFFDIRNDTFKHLNDGIHEICCIDYLEYLRYKNLHVPYASAFQDLKIFLVRKNNISMFIAQTRKGQLSILNGGKRKNLKYSDINYYYNNMDKVADMIQKTSKNYFDYIHAISNEVIKIGGDGHVHGCIVDFDFLNKIYVNPFDGKITAYCTPSLYSKERIVYNSVHKMLRENISASEKIEAMCHNFENLCENSMLIAEKSDHEKMYLRMDDHEFSSAYKISYSMKKIEEFFDNNVIKIWPDEIEPENKITLSSHK